MSIPRTPIYVVEWKEDDPPTVYDTEEFANDMMENSVRLSVGRVRRWDWDGNSWQVDE